MQTSVLRDIGFDDLGLDISDPLIQEVLQQVAPQRHRVIIKGSDCGKGLWLMSGVKGTDKLPKNAGYVADIQASVNYAVGRILGEKLPKLGPLTDYHRKFLLIWSDLPLGRQEEVAEALTHHDLMNSCLDGVFFIDYGWKCIAPLWARAPVP